MTKQLGDYGDGTGRYQSEYRQLWNDLVPESGHCETTAGELIRSAGKLSYDFYANMSTNNTSGAVNFLRQHKVIDAKTHRTIHRSVTGITDEDHVRIVLDLFGDSAVKECPDCGINVPLYGEYNAWWCEDCQQWV